ncbi:MAG TPA: secretin N-terminal domain-containing protein [Longimicrobiales bacterium]|nr:secretin N-terminal domain-containing protein [Longimicrobiales bacterium]
MIPILLTLLVGAFAPDKSITSVAVQPQSDRTEVLVRLDGDVTWRHFALHSPERVVIDIAGAKQGLALEFSDIKRGGVTGMRIGQYSPQVVRVVIDLSSAIKYDIAEVNGQISMSFPNPEGTFEPWQTGMSSRLARAPVPEEKTSTKASQPQQQRTQPRVTVSFNEEPLMNVLLTFSDFAGKSIVSSPDAKGVTVTADVRDQPWDIALEAILQANGLAAREGSSGIIIVELAQKIADRAKLQPQETQMFEVKYVSADSLINTIRPLLSPAGGAGQPGGSVSVNSAANALVIRDTRSALNDIGRMILQMDVRTPQVTIAAKIIFIDRTALEALGFVYDLKDSRGTQLNSLVQGWDDKNGNGVFESGEETDQNLISLGGNSVAALANATNRVASPALQMVTSLLLGRHSLITFIDALQSVNLSDIQAAPSITVLNHREARIQVGERTPVRVVDASSAGSGGGGGAPTASVRTEQTGIILRVTPHITGNQVLLDLHAERSNIALAPSDLGFTFQTQEAETQVLVDNGETAVIGGLTIIEKTKVRAGIPFLMDLPLLGALFRNVSDRENKRDLLIMVTPHIVREGTP